MNWLWLQILSCTSIRLHSRIDNHLKALQPRCTIDFFQDITAPSADAGLDTTLNCQRRQLRLRGLGTTFSGQILYAWSTTDGNIAADANTQMPLIDEAGSYLFSVTDPVNSCTTQDIVEVTEDTIPPVASFVDDTRLFLNCYFPNTILDASASTATDNHPITYAWRTQGIGTPIDGSTGVSVVIQEAGSYELAIMDEVNGCRDTLLVSVTSDFGQPNASILSPDIITCAQPTIEIVSTTNSADSLNYVYSWLRLPSTIPLGSDITQMVDQSGDYALILVDTVNGCQRQMSQ